MSQKIKRAKWIFHKCSICGKRRLKTFKIYVPNPSSGKFKVQYMCEKCMKKIYHQDIDASSVEK